jgi:hypothetical protein
LGLHGQFPAETVDLEQPDAEKTGAWLRLAYRQPYTQFIISAAWSLAMYRVLRAQGETIEAVGQLIYEVDWAFLRWILSYFPDFFIVSS